MKVHELADRSGVPAHVIRFYTRIGLLVPERNPHNGYKAFEEPDLLRVRFIRLAQHHGYTLKEIALLLKAVDEGESPCHGMAEILRRRIRDVDRRLEQLSQVRAKMTYALQHLDRDTVETSDLNALCRLIEASPEHRPNHALDLGVAHRFMPQNGKPLPDG